MDPLQADHEKAAGDRLISALNDIEGLALQYLSRGDEAPDLVYSDGTARVGVEVGTAYYHAKDAEMRWKIARGDASAPKSWGDKSKCVSKWCVEPDANLLASLKKLLEDKSRKAYGSNIWLLIPVYPSLTSWEDFETLCEPLALPTNHGFQRIFIAGNFPFSWSYLGELKSQAAYRIFQLYPSRRLIYTESFEIGEARVGD